MGKRKNPAAVALGRMGGKAPRKGRIGFARFSKTKRSSLAKAAALARWGKKKKGA
jgi:hypothetical protein